MISSDFTADLTADLLGDYSGGFTLQQTLRQTFGHIIYGRLLDRLYGRLFGILFGDFKADLMADLRQTLRQIFGADFPVKSHFVVFQLSTVRQLSLNTAFYWNIDPKIIDFYIRYPFAYRQTHLALYKWPITWRLINDPATGLQYETISIDREGESEGEERGRNQSPSILPVFFWMTHRRTAVSRYKISIIINNQSWLSF